MPAPALDFALGESADMIREAAERFARERIAPLAARIDAQDWFPREELWTAMGDLGLHGITVAEEFGGLGLGYLEHVVACEEVSRASASIGLSYGAHSNLCVNQIHRWGNAQQKARYLPRLVSGEHVGSLAMSEAGSGSDVVSMKLKADKVEGGWRLNGTKFWITNAACADTLVVYARSDAHAESRGITTFLIEKDMPGFAIGQKIDKMGMRGSPTAELVFSDCFVPDENVMGPVGGGVGILMSGLDYERVVLSGIQLGIMQACLDVVLPFVRERRQFGQAIGTFQLMQAKVADMYVALNSARAYVYTVAKACDAGQTTRFDAAGAILLASENAVKVALEAVQALGGAGYTKDWPVERFLRDAKLLDIGAGTNEIRRMLIGRELIGSERVGVPQRGSARPPSARKPGGCLLHHGAQPHLLLDGCAVIRHRYQHGPDRRAILLEDRGREVGRTGKYVAPADRVALFACPGEVLQHGGIGRLAQKRRLLLGGHIGQHRPGGRAGPRGDHETDRHRRAQVMQALQQIDDHEARGHRARSATPIRRFPATIPQGSRAPCGADRGSRGRAGPRCGCGRKAPSASACRAP